MAAEIPLRPFSMGELLDRALTLYLRNIIPFTALLVVVIAPLFVMQFLGTKDFLTAYIALISATMHGHGSSPSAMNAAMTKMMEHMYTGSSLGYLAISYIFVFFVVPLANAAVVVGVSRAYLGMPVRFGDCYRMAFKRWLYVIILLLLWLLAVAIAAAVLFGLLLLVTLVMAPLMATVKVAGIVLAVVFSSVTFVTAIAGMALVYLLMAYSFIAVVLEKIDPVQAFSSSFARVFGQFWRSVALALVLLVIYMGFGIVFAGAGMLLAYQLKSSALYFVGTALTQIVTYAFAFIVIALYYYDIRVRREGFDLQMLADQLTAATGPAKTA